MLPLARVSVQHRRDDLRRVHVQANAGSSLRHGWFLQYVIVGRHAGATAWHNFAPATRGEPASSTAQTGRTDNPYCLDEWGRADRSQRRPTRRRRRARATHAADHRQPAGLHPNAPQRPVPAGPARRARSIRCARRPRHRQCRADRPARAPAMSASDWHEALGAYWDEYESIDTGPQGRSPSLLVIDRADPAVWRLRQIIKDPDGNHDFAILGSVDLDASDAAGEPVVRIESL